MGDAHKTAEQQEKKREYWAITPAAEELPPPLRLPQTLIPEDLSTYLDTFLDTREFATALSTPPDTTLRVNTMNLSVSDAIEGLRRTFAEMDEKEGTDRYSKMIPVPLTTIPDAITIKMEGANMPEEHYKEVIVDRKCGEAVLRGADVFIPGVKGMCKNVRKGEKVAVVANVSDIVPKGYAKPLMKGRAFVGCGVIQVTRKRIFTPPFEGVAVKMDQPLYASHPLNGINMGDVFLQNYPSMLAAHALDPQAGERVLDMCASPGGKTTHIAALMKGEGEVVAFDRVEHKAEDVNQLARRFGLNNVKAMKFDSTLCADPEAVKAHGMKGLGEESFDRILADVPCTSLGNSPRLTVDIRLKDIKSQGMYQRRFIDAAVKMLKPGGTLVYSTCSVAVDENEANVRYALDSHPLELVAPAICVGGPGVAPLTPEERPLVQRFHPHTPTSDGVRTIGFFMAKFVKRVPVGTKRKAPCTVS